MKEDLKEYNQDLYLWPVATGQGQNFNMGKCLFTSLPKKELSMEES